MDMEKRLEQDKPFQHKTRKRRTICPCEDNGRQVETMRNQAGHSGR